MEFLEQIWQFILSIFGSFDNMLADVVKFDQVILNLYNEWIMPYPEWIKILGALGVVIVLIAGILSIAKKMLKLVIFIAVILAILVLARILMTP